MNTYIVISSAGPNRDLAKGSREQAYWDEHAAFIDALFEEGFILLGGPLVDESGAVLVVQAADEHEVSRKVAGDPWYQRGLLKLDGIKRWQIFIDQWPGWR
jgi:uncharacterized protein YciI